MNKAELTEKLINEHEKVNERLNYHLGKLLTPKSIAERDLHEKMKIKYELEQSQIMQWLNCLTDDNADEINNEFDNSKKI